MDRTITFAMLAQIISWFAKNYFSTVNFNKILFIKEIREVTNWGLKDAKDLADLFNPVIDLLYSLKAKEEKPGDRLFRVSWSVTSATGLTDDYRATVQASNGQEALNKVVENLNIRGLVNCHLHKSNYVNVDGGCSVPDTGVKLETWSVEYDDWRVY